MYDYVIAGAGVIGLTTAFELTSRQPGLKILILEKEAATGFHSSGRNSGVLHSGIYYPPASLKAKFCCRGSALMHDYCRKENLPLNPMGKVIVPANEQENTALDKLYERAQINGAEVRFVDEVELKRIEPEARSASGRALYSPKTSVIAPKEVLKSLVGNLQARGVTICFASAINKIDPAAKTVSCDNEKLYEYGHFINAAGSFVDHLAKPFGLGEEFTMLPFKGVYYKLSPVSQLKFNGLIYPVPDVNLPFLGVHTVLDVNGEVYFGPSAIPALGRENYALFEKIETLASMQSAFYLMRNYLSNNQGIRKYAHREFMQFFKKNFVRAAQKLVPALQPKDLVSCSKVGIRAQLYNKQENKLEMDFIIRHTENSTHVLNTVSPGFTSSFAVAEHLVDHIIEKA